MGSRNTSVLFFAAIALFLSLHFPSQTEATIPAELASKVCAQSEIHSYETCVKFLTANPKSLMVSSAKAVAENALDMARRETTDTSCFFAALLKRKDINAASKAALESCSSLFKQSVTFISLDGLSGGTASLDLHSALDKATLCKSKLSAAHVSIKSVSDKLEQWGNFYSVASAAVYAVESPEH